ncbi:heavy metal transport/detoxification protein [uncultured Odoribacter sp.]|uniref:heavy-metal-associated domain-containing protein n=1 Tax=uncultured Odoribacter sp. TaxID=876416 RepID=UPI00262C5628|nr:heavy metal transport/detoxification protein [uncultured Odoribacter sp.]
MEIHKFKTTAKCQGCVAKIRPFLNQIVPENQWIFDLSDPDRILTVQGDYSDEKIIQALQKAGFKAEMLK